MGLLRRAEGGLPRVAPIIQPSGVRRSTKTCGCFVRPRGEAADSRGAFSSEGMMEIVRDVYTKHYENVINSFTL